MSAKVNYLHLLPITPLDGGRVLETFAFARHPRWRFGFAVLCCGLLLASGIALDDLVLKVFAVLVADVYKRQRQDGASSWAQIT